MRKHLVLACLCSVASAAPATEKPKPIDIKPMIGKLDVYKDELGNVYVLPNKTVDTDDATKWLFYGDGKAMYQQTVFGFGSDDHGRSYTMWSPRVKDMTGAGIDVTDTAAVLRCRSSSKDQRVMKPLKADEARGILEHAKFYAPLWHRQSKFLARDDDGVYYFVDQLREEYGGNGYRVFVGQKGAMKELPMTNQVSDSAGEIYATKTGQLKIITGKDGKALWVKGGKKTELTVLEPQDNRYLIYRDLGIYGQLGAVCDDL